MGSVPKEKKKGARNATELPEAAAGLWFLMRDETRCTTSERAKSDRMAAQSSLMEGKRRHARLCTRGVGVKRTGGWREQARKKKEEKEKGTRCSGCTRAP